LIQKKEVKFLKGIGVSTSKIFKQIKGFNKNYSIIHSKLEVDTIYIKLFKDETN
jgi:hypothetical protein